MNTETGGEYYVAYTLFILRREKNGESGVLLNCQLSPGRDVHILTENTSGQARKCPGFPGATLVSSSLL
jgi:hypothetical protein